VDGLVAMLTGDVRMTASPAPGDAAVTFRHGLTCRLVATRANGQPAFGVFVRDPGGGVLHATGLLVLTLAGSRICAITRFGNSVLPRFGLPLTLSG